ncbi:MAG: indolepyruvate ferredoxin oxidoreductase, partial [Novosphingobium sp.]
MTVDIGRVVVPVLPEIGEVPAPGIHNFPTHLDRVRSEIIAKRYRMPLVAKFVRANGIDKVLIDAPARRIGIVAAGKAVQDARQAIAMLGLDQAQAAAIGISLYKLGCVYPVEPTGLVEFAAGQQELLFIEEKDPLTEGQAKTILYGKPDGPRIVGKQDE